MKFDERKKTEDMCATQSQGQNGLVYVLYKQKKKPTDTNNY